MINVQKPNASDVQNSDNSVILPLCLNYFNRSSDC